MKDHMIFCTCAQRNQAYYMKRIAAWKQQLIKLGIYDTADVYVIIDGHLTEQSIPGLHFITFPKPLGRVNTSNFPGFKRSFAKAMQISINYKYCLHLQNDCYIQNKNMLLDYYEKPVTAFCSCPQYNFQLQPVFLILNNKQHRQSLLDVYSKPQNINQSTLFERTAIKYLKPYQSMGTSYRMQKPCSDLTPYTCLGQCTAQYILGR